MASLPVRALTAGRRRGAQEEFPARVARRASRVTCATDASDVGHLTFAASLVATFRSVHVRKESLAGATARERGHRRSGVAPVVAGGRRPLALNPLVVGQVERTDACLFADNAAGGSP